MRAVVAQANAWLDYHQGYCFGKERGLLSQDVLLEAIRKAAGQERRSGIGHRFFKGYTDALIDAGVWRPGREHQRRGLAGTSGRTTEHSPRR
jgi:hypothetical protein